jgi:DNA-binding XRE family transcriptional regulator
VICRVRHFREELGLTIKEAATGAGLSPAGLHAIEMGGDVMMSTAHKLCRFFSLETGQLWPLE